MNARRKILAGFWMSALALAIAAVSLTTGAQSADVKADYDRSNTLNQRTQNKVVDVAEAPVWIGSASGALEGPHRTAEVLPGSYGVINNDRR